MVKKLKKKGGVSLVEEICAVAILMIVVLGVLSLIGASHTSVLAYNAKDQAYAKAEEVGDRVMAALAESDYDSMPNGDSETKDVLGDSDDDGKADAICERYDYAAEHDHSVPPKDKYNRPYYFYLKVSNKGIDGNYSPITGYNIYVIQYYGNKDYVDYVGYNMFVCTSGKDV